MRVKSIVFYMTTKRKGDILVQFTRKENHGWKVTVTRDPAAQQSGIGSAYKSDLKPSHKLREYDYERESVDLAVASVFADLYELS